MAEQNRQAPAQAMQPGTGAWTPVPDPTVLTTQATDAAKDQLRREIQCLREIIETRLDAIDRATVLLQTYQGGMPKLMQEAVVHAQTLMDERLRTQEEKFRSIQIQFTERDTRAEQTSRDSKVAVDAALQAAKEAVGAQNASSALAIAKSEAATMKQIDQLGTLFQTGMGSLDSKISDLKDRLTLIEGRTAGMTGQQATQQTSSSFVLAIVVAGISALGLVAMVLFNIAK
jgi:hypothetical protein